MATNNVKRIIKENGIVLERIFKKATNEFKGQDGRVVPAQPDRYYLKCVTGEEFTKESGYLNSTVLEYPVDVQIFDKAQFNSPVIVKYELSNYGAKAVSADLKETK